MKPRCLDLGCGAGGAAVGYAQAGYEVVGVDLMPQPDYPFEFHLGNMLTWPIDGYDLIHASPPCKHRTIAANANRRLHLFDPHPDLLGPMLDRLQERRFGCPWVVENVPTDKSVDDGLPLPALMLCGSMFGLQVRRHRLFWSNATFTQPSCDHKAQAQRGRVYWVFGHTGGVSKREPQGRGLLEDWQRAMGIDWMKVKNLSQAIPPAYTRYIADHLR